MLHDSRIDLQNIAMKNNHVHAVSRTLSCMHVKLLHKFLYSKYFPEACEYECWICGLLFRGVGFDFDFDFFFSLQYPGVAYRGRMLVEVTTEVGKFPETKKTLPIEKMDVDRIEVQYFKTCLLLLLALATLPC